MVLALFGVSNGAIQFMTYEELKKWRTETRRNRMGGKISEKEAKNLVRPVLLREGADGGRVMSSTSSCLARPRRSRSDSRTRTRSSVRGFKYVPPFLPRLADAGSINLLPSHRTLRFPTASRGPTRRRGCWASTRDSARTRCASCRARALRSWCTSSSADSWRGGRAVRAVNGTNVQCHRISESLFRSFRPTFISRTSALRRAPTKVPQTSLGDPALTESARIMLRSVVARTSLRQALRPSTILRAASLTLPRVAMAAQRDSSSTASTAPLFRLEQPSAAEEEADFQAQVCVARPAEPELTWRG